MDIPKQSFSFGGATRALTPEFLHKYNFYPNFNFYVWVFEPIQARSCAVKEGQ